ncbi:MAG: CsgE family curli-type amyloid fiber assembly protein [Anditalea sp.]
MKVIFTTIFLFFLFLETKAQFDVDPSSAKKQYDSVPVQEAPDALKLLLQKITEEETEKLKNEVELEIDGLLIDETKTKSGRDFFDYFYRHWEAPPEARNYSIFIKESPFRLSTTMIEVFINETRVIQSFLQPRAEFVEALAAESIATTKMYLIRYEEIVKELDGDERSGSGIF